MERFFPIGVTYGGTLPREEWEDDFREIRDAGFNCVRLSADRRKPEDLDYILDLVEEYDVKAIIALDHQILPGAHADPWLSSESFKLEVESFFYKPIIERLAPRPGVLAWAIPLPDRSGAHADAITWQIDTISSYDSNRPIVKEARRVPPPVPGPVAVSCHVSPMQSMVRWQRERYLGYILRKAAGDVSGEEIWATEIQAGPSWRRIDYGLDDVAMAFWTCLAHGAKSLIFDRWDPGADPTRDTSIKDLNGSHWHGLKRITADIHRLQELPGLMRGRPLAPTSAVLMPRRIESSAPLLSVERARGAYRLLADNFAAVTFVDDTVSVEDLRQYSVVYAPLLPSCSRRLAEALTEYVRGGGSIIAEAPFAAEDETGAPYEEAPGAGLSEVFGCKVRAESEDRARPVATTSIAQGVFTYVGANLKFHIDGPTEDLEVHARRSTILEFLDERTMSPTGPAVVIGKFGEGKAAYVAGGLSQAYRFMEHPYARELFSGILDWMEVPRQVEVTGLTKGFENEFEVAVIGGIDESNRRAIICINHSEMSVHPALILPVGPDSVVRELFTNTEIQMESSKSDLHIMTHVPEREIRVYYEVSPTDK